MKRNLLFYFDRHICEQNNAKKVCTTVSIQSLSYLINRILEQ
jgi:hypothetical protein